jgi:hypothetical protein
MKTLLLCAAAVLALLITGSANDKIKSVMKAHFKGETSDLKKAAAGELDKAAMDKFIADVNSITGETPPKGAKPEFKAKMTALATALQAGEKGKIKMAANCKACHDVHK